MLLEQVRRDSQKTNSESSNDDYIIIPVPKIIVESGDQQRFSKNNFFISLILIFEDLSDAQRTDN